MNPQPSVSEHPVADKENLVQSDLIIWEPSSPTDVRPVVMADNFLAKVLRAHQQEGVRFLFGCLSGRSLEDLNCFGCILADDMGLGKTLQSIAVLYTLINTKEVICHAKIGDDPPLLHTSLEPSSLQPLVSRALILCPASLVKNWASEIDKWIPDKRLKYIAVAESEKEKVKALFQAFRFSREARVLIVSYETFRNHHKIIKDVHVDMLLCDEAHRLKNDKSQTTKLINGLKAKRRLLISGTPVQNDLDEFFTLVLCANPTLTPKDSSFHKRYVIPIMRGREPDATEGQLLTAEERLNELSLLTNRFILRRTNAAVLAKLLPPKLIILVFIAPSEDQVIEYQRITSLESSGKLKILPALQALTKICTHPNLLDGSSRSEQQTKSSTKIDVLMDLLKESWLIGDKVVVISNFTQTLDLVGVLCTKQGWPYTRLDGSVGTAKRAILVNEFNAQVKGDHHSKSNGSVIMGPFVFLLSSKAGGCGINLIGANRLVMLDASWNPSEDKQAMARVWREGQPKECFVYRFFTAGTLEEKILQRQIFKGSLARAVDVANDNDGMNTVAQDSQAARKFMALTSPEHCDTHDTFLGCKCHKESVTISPWDEEDLSTWTHSKQSTSNSMLLSHPTITFLIHCRISHD